MNLDFRLRESWIYAGRAALMLSLLTSVLFVFGTKRNDPQVKEFSPKIANELTETPDYVTALIDKLSTLSVAATRQSWSGPFIQAASSKELTGRDGLAIASVRNPFADKQVDLMQIGNVYRIVVDGEDYGQGDFVGNGVEISAVTPLSFSVRVAGKTARFDIQ